MQALPPVPQVMKVSAEVIVPCRGAVTVNVWVFSVKLAPTALSPSIVSGHAPVPVQAPDQAAKL